MGKNSKGFKALLAKKRWEEATDRTLEQLEAKIVQEYGKDLKVVTTSAAETKISIALNQLIEPYEPNCYSKEALHQLLSIGVLAWNLSLTPEKDKKTFREKTLTYMTEIANSSVSKGAEEFLDTLIQRKQELFPNDRRLIMDFQLEYAASGSYHLSAASITP